MGEDVVAVFERMLTQEVGERKAHYLKKSHDFYDPDWTYEDVEAIEAEFARDLRSVAARVETAWGPPEFIGHRDNSPFPNFYTFEELCYWRRGNLLAIIWWEHQDKELPVLLALDVFKPEDLSA